MHHSMYFVGHSHDSVKPCWLLQVKRLFSALKVDFTAIELDEVGTLQAIQPASCTLPNLSLYAGQYCVKALCACDNVAM